MVVFQLAMLFTLLRRLAHYAFHEPFDVFVVTCCL